MRVNNSYIFIWIIWCVLTNAVQDEKEKFLVKQKEQKPFNHPARVFLTWMLPNCVSFLWTGGKLNAVVSKGFEVVDYESEVRN